MGFSAGPHKNQVKSIDLRTIPNLHGYLSAASESGDYEERACARNFLLDERPPQEALDLYKPHFTSGAVLDMDDWYSRHHGFALEQIFLDPGESDAPVTFRPLNDRNRVTQIDERLDLIQVEQGEWPCSLRGDSFVEIADRIKRFRAGDDAARGFLQGLCNAWNAERDRRPAYVTTEIQVEDILADGVEDWAVRLRNRLGLSHLDPGHPSRSWSCAIRWRRRSPRSTGKAIPSFPPCWTATSATTSFRAPCRDRMPPKRRCTAGR